MMRLILFLGTIAWLLLEQSLASTYPGVRKFPAFHAVFPRNGTAPTFSGNGSYTFANATGTCALGTGTGIVRGTGTGSSCAAATPTPTQTIDTTCGETATPFTVQVGTQPSGGLFDGWFLSVSGNGILFTSSKASASSFSVEATGHLCAVGRLGDRKRPLIAIVGNATETGEDASDVWLLDAEIAIGNFSQWYTPASCTVSGGAGGLACGTDITQKGTGGEWLSCGLQLGLTSETGSVVDVDGMNCSSISLSALY